MFGLFRKSKDPKPLPTRVVLEEESVNVFAGAQPIESFRWSELVSVRAWKQDCFGIDRIWIGFDLRGNDEPVCVHEEAEGYKALVGEMERRCHGFKPGWWDEVAFPAFAVNHTLVWEDPQSAQQHAD